jgi:hypothetical protein
MTELISERNSVVYLDHDPSLKPSYAEAKLFLQLLDPTTDRFTFQTFDDNDDRKDGSLAHIIHGTLDERFLELSKLNVEKRAGIFVTVNATDFKGRKEKNLARIRSTWGDFDHAASAQPALPPSIVTSTSPGKWHVYWLCEGLTQEQHQGVLEHIVQAHGADPNATGVLRVLRLPGFYHRKAAPYMVRVMPEHSKGACYTATQVLAAFPPAERQAAELAVPKPVDRSRLNDALRCIPADDRKVWLTVGAAIKQQFAEEGYEPWCKWSAQSGKYDPADQLKTWRSLKKTDADGKVITIATVFWLAQQHGWTGKSDSDDDFGDIFGPRKSRVLWIDDEPPTKDIPWLVDEMIPVGGMGFLAAKAKEGKTYLAVDLALCVAFGVPFFGRKIASRGGTHIIAAEGAYGTPRRIRTALAEKFAKGQADAKVPITFEKGAPDLLTAAGLKAFIEEMRAVAEEMQRRYGVPLRLLIIDTFSKGFTVADEDKVAETGKATRAMQVIADALGIAVISLHHFGKDLSKGMRGSSRLGADADFVLIIRRKGELFLDMCREAEDSIVLGNFELRAVTVGVKPDGTPITSCYVRHHEAKPWPAEIEAEAKRSRSEQALLDALGDVLASKGETQVPPGESEPQHVAKLEDVRGAFYARRGGSAESNKKALQRAREGLHSRLRNGTWGGVEWIWAVAPFKQEN